MRLLRSFLLAVGVAASGLVLAAGGSDSYEVWAIDQSNSPGLAYGGTIHIWNGHSTKRTLCRARIFDG